MKTDVLAAFRAVCGGFSPDRVVADPGLNALFLEQCRQRGLVQPPRELNASLLNARKDGSLKGSAPSKRTSFSSEDDYRFASEVAVRHLGQRYSTTLDRIICDPELAAQFDAIAQEIAPGFAAVQYRWAALNLRKSKRLRPELVSRVVPSDELQLGRIDELDTTKIPVKQGVYIFFGSKDVLYVGEAENLRRRIEKHLDHSDNKGLARWLWENGAQDVRLEIRILPVSTEQRVRRALESELIHSRRPVFNVKR